MKKFVFLSISLLTVCMNVFAVTENFSSKTRENQNKDFYVINIYDLNDQKLNEIMQGDHPEIAVEFATGTRFPLSIFLNGDLLNLVETEERFGAIEIKQSFYARCVGKEWILSSDLTDWKTIPEFLTGTASGLLNIQEGQPSIAIGAEIHRRS